MGWRTARPRRERGEGRREMQDYKCPICGKSSEGKGNIFLYGEGWTWRIIEGKDLLVCPDCKERGSALYDSDGEFIGESK
jgi:DNA-directed RNA polymerase subunit RPC12/RpoP